MARMPSFLRKGAPSPANPASGGDERGAPTVDGADEYDAETPIASPDSEQDPKDIAVCPKCGCVFNDESGEVIPEGHAAHPASGSPAGGPGSDSDTGNDDSAGGDES